jgi:predicted MFS family arabinose efflux permease
VTITLARRHLPAHKARAGVAALSVTAATGLGLGYPLTGLVAEHLDYRVAFWVAVLFSGSALALAPLIIPRGHSAGGRPDLSGWLLRTAGLGSGAVIPGGQFPLPVLESAPRRNRRSFDLPGTALLAAGLGAGLLALSETADWGWGSPVTIALLAASAALLTAWARWELHTNAPLIRLDLLRRPDVLIANVAALGLGTSMYIGFAAVGQLAQTPRSTGYGLGLSVFLAGIVILPLSAGSQVANRVVGAVSAKVPPRTLLPLGALFVTVANAGLAVRHDRMWELMAAMALFGFGIGSTFAAMPALIIGAVPLTEVGSATSFNSVLRVIGGSIGSAVTGAVLARHLRGGLPVESGYRDAFEISAALCAVLLVLLVLDVVRSQRSPCSC